MLDKARKTAITEVVAEPGVRVFVRKIVMKNAVVTTGVPPPTSEPWSADYLTICLFNKQA